MLFAKENKVERKLILHCEFCDESQDADEKCVYRNETALSASRLFNFQDVVADPTLPRANDVECANCHHNEAVFMKDPVSKDNEGLTLHFICTNCKHNWKPGERAPARAPDLRALLLHVCAARGCLAPRRLRRVADAARLSCDASSREPCACSRHRSFGRGAVRATRDRRASGCAVLRALLLD
jgi:DNA-directed RNA polymerase II subunit RPB9